MPVEKLAYTNHSRDGCEDNYADITICICEHCMNGLSTVPNPHPYGFITDVMKIISESRIAMFAKNPGLPGFFIGCAATDFAPPTENHCCVPGMNR